MSRWARPRQGWVLMTNVPNGSPSVTDIARRLQRVEDKLDERIATVDMLQATKELFTARELANVATVQGHEQRISKLEATNARLMVAVVVAFLGLLVQALIQ